MKPDLTGKVAVVTGAGGTLCSEIAKFLGGQGAKVALMQDRPVLGGNCSSEIRMWISGAGTRVRDLQETGIMEELLLENMHRNPKRNFTIWDSILYELVRFEDNIDLMLNCACCDAKMNGDKIEYVKGFQLTTYTWHEVHAKIFVDSSGDSILAPLTGAEYRVGREAKSEFGEEFGLDVADNHTMGMSLMIQCRETDHPVSYTPPAWAYDFPDDDAMNNKPHKLYEMNTNFYWIELGGMQNSIDDTEEVRDELLKIAYGIWDHVKNYGDHNAENWTLEWVGCIPGKRESRRYIGAHVLTENDVEAGGKFDDIVAFGGWPMDDHNPAGFRSYMTGAPASKLYPAPSPYGIPYRVLYGHEVDNLFFAGRNISATHAAMSSTRVMATCALIGQAMGTAASICVNEGVTPHGVYETKMKTLQDKLRDAGCYIPGTVREIPELTKQANINLPEAELALVGRLLLRALRQRHRNLVHLHFPPSKFGFFDELRGESPQIVVVLLYPQPHTLSRVDTLISYENLNKLQDYQPKKQRLN